MLSHERLAARPQEASEHERDDDDVIELAGNRDEIRNQVERHRQVADESKQEQLPTKRHPVVANEPSDENDAVGNESGESACIAPAAGKQEHQDEQQPRNERDAEADQAPGPPRHVVAVSTIDRGAVSAARVSRRPPGYPSRAGPRRLAA
jgi:hypothetical protein